MYGARVSLGVALVATVLQITLGLVIGLAAALGSRRTDQVLSRITDINVALPIMVIALALLAIVPETFPGRSSSPSSSAASTGPARRRSCGPRRSP